MQALKRHPFAVEAYFDFSLVLAYALPKKVLESLLPPALEVDNFGEHGFVAAAMVQTTHLRPKGFPAFLGNNFFLIGYRIFVKYHDTKGKRLRGLYILGSQTDKRKMQFLGNLFTQYKYEYAPIQWNKHNEQILVSCQSNEPKNRFQVKISKSENPESIALPEQSPFADWKEARRFAGPLPFTFDYEQETNSMILVEGVRQNWVPQPVIVEEADIGFIKDKFPHQTPLLANAFIVENIPYSWKKGRIEKITVNQNA